MRLTAFTTRGGRILGSLLLVVVCVLAFLSVIVPFVLGAQSYTVLTGSMRPALEPGHLVGARATPIEAIAPGDIVTFQIESGRPEVATHRVVGIRYDRHGERLLLTQGDANNAQDEAPVQEAQLRGVVVYAVPLLGYVNIWATPGVKSIVVSVLGILAIGWGLFVLLKDQRRRRRARTGVSVAAVAVLLVLAPSTTPSASAEESDPLQLSSDGSGAST